jgi:hypothetical protein
MATLDYDSVDNWLKLGAIMVRWFDANRHLLHLNNDQDCWMVFHKIAQEGRDMGFNLKQGYRTSGAKSIAAQLDPRLVDFYYRDRDRSWLEVIKTKKRS